MFTIQFHYHFIQVLLLEVTHFRKVIILNQHIMIFAKFYNLF